MIKSYKYRLYPTTAQKGKIEETLNACRFIYNLSLETKISAWQSDRRTLSAYDLHSQLTDLKTECKWLAKVDSQALQASINNMDKAYQNFFKGAGFPKFKSKKGKQAFHCRNNARRVDFKKSTVTVPKIADIPAVISRPFNGAIKIITISKTANGKYFASVIVETEESLPVKNGVCKRSTVGVDLGIKSFAITSEGDVFPSNNKLRSTQKRLKVLQRRVDRKKKDSKNRRKAVLILSTLHEKIANQRADYVHKITTKLIRDSQAKTFVVEDLHVVGMLKNRKLSKAIQDASFGEFFRQMKYKCDWYGKNLIVIDRFSPSSKRCSECGEINQELTLADREWDCSCGAHHDRDLNAAKNIKWFGLNNSPVGSRSGPVESRRIRRAKKQEIS